MSEQAPPGDPRVFLAIERTFLAWTRTALALMGFGFVVARLGLFLREMELARTDAALGSSTASVSGSLVLGCGLIIAGVAVQALALYEHRRRVRSFHNGLPISPMQLSSAALVALAIIVAGVVGTTYLITRAM